MCELRQVYLTFPKACAWVLLMVCQSYSCAADQEDLLLLAAGVPAVVHKALDRVRQFMAADLGEIDESKHALLWITGAPKLHQSFSA